MSEKRQQEVPGEQADRPQDIPRRGWMQIAKRGWKESQDDQVPLLAAGVAFYAFMSLFPALVALVLIYGLVADPAQISQQASQLTDALPGQVQQLITNQLTMVSAHSRGAGFGMVVSILIALWSASSGTANLLTAISTAYDEEETRSFIKKRALALGLTVLGIIFMIVVLFLVAALPAVLQLFDNVIVRVLLQVVRWVLLVGLVTAALAVLYRVAPDRDAPKIKWVSVGAIIATLLWVIASVGFSIYVANFGNYAKTYGTVAGIVVLLFWLWLTSYAILLGAEINAEAEQQTIVDTTRGEPQPLGNRNAVKADSVPDGEASGQSKSSHPTTGDQTSGDTMSDPSTQASQAQASAPDHTEPARTDPSEASVRELVRQMSEDSSRLIRSEIRLAQAEMSAKAKDVGVGIGGFSAAGLLAFFGIGVLLAAAVLGLSTQLPGWLSAVIIGVVLLVIAGIIALVARRKLSQAAPPMPERTVETVKQDVQEIKERARS